ncbi:MAG: hypothetical protein ACLQU1_16040 [Bryobacteraceae bacterium]
MPDQAEPRLDFAARLAALWCRLTHDAPMWPIHGAYRCRICSQIYRVPWAGGQALEPPTLAIPPRERVAETA